jgi:hypothetical protein
MNAADSIKPSRFAILFVWWWALLAVVVGIAVRLVQSIAWYCIGLYKRLDARHVALCHKSLNHLERYTAWRNSE